MKAQYDQGRIALKIQAEKWNIRYQNTGVKERNPVISPAFRDADQGIFSKLKSRLPHEAVLGYHAKKAETLL
jgi:hypothetical protein